MHVLEVMKNINQILYNLRKNISFSREKRTGQFESDEQVKFIERKLIEQIM